MATGAFDAIDEEFFREGERLGDRADDLSDLDPPRPVPRWRARLTSMRAALVAAGLVLGVGVAARMTLGAEEVPVVSPVRTAAP